MSYLTKIQMVKASSKIPVPASESIYVGSLNFLFAYPVPPRPMPSRRLPVVVLPMCVVVGVAGDAGFTIFFGGSIGFDGSVGTWGGAWAEDGRV